MKRYLVFMGIALCVFAAVIFVACKKSHESGDTKALQRNNIDRTIKMYEEIGEKHNSFLSRSFKSVHKKLKSSGKVLNGTASRDGETMTEEELRNVVLDVSSEELIPLLGGKYSEEQIRTELVNNLPADLTMEGYSSTYQCVSENGLGVALSSTFNQALTELDIILERCNEYEDSLNIFTALNQLREQYIPLMLNSSELEAFIAGTILAKHSLRYWAVNEQAIIDLYAGDLSNRTKTPRHIAFRGGKANPAKADVRGMITGGIRGAVQGGFWGSAIPGIGTAWGAVAGGLVGAGTSGCVSSLAAGIWNAFH